MLGNKVIPISIKDNSKTDYKQYDLTQRQGNSSQCTWYGNMQLRRSMNLTKWLLCEQNSSNNNSKTIEQDIDDVTFRFKWGRCIKSFVYLSLFFLFGILIVPVIVLVDNYNFARYSGYIGTASLKPLTIQYMMNLMWI